MIRALRYAILAILAVVLIVIALSNTQIVTLRLLPEETAGVLGFGWSLQVPLFVAIMAGVLLGLLIGFVWEWAREYRIRSRGAQEARKAKALERELGHLKQRHEGPQDDVLAVLERAPSAR
ncbi:LapA family protein (plasmid) [Thioclava litoralis]|uniref:LapA family protein n=1 Tax=Thioclava litoralis TaxID=3076557 RepID=A0ABZ1E6R7_9RHOB|nr:LapA family protein [Thioclava sp. FTW29]